MEKLKEQFTQLEAIIKQSSYKEQHKMIKQLNDFTDRLSLEAVEIKPTDYQIVKVGIDREDAESSFGRRLADEEWKSVAHEIEHSHKIDELCKEVVIAYVEHLAMSGFLESEKTSTKHENPIPST